MWDRNTNPDCTLFPRVGPLQNHDALLSEVADQALCFSNIIRGFSFVPGNEKFMYNNLLLLDIIGKLLMLRVDRDEELRKAELRARKWAEEAEKPADKTTDALLAVKDSTDRLLLEVANSLRDDAFTILAHISVQLDLYNVDNKVAYSILDALLHWSVTTNVQARDPIQPNATTPSAYAFEVICKMSLLETNVDLLLATGPWPRIEEFVRVVCNSITMSEEVPIRWVVPSPSLSVQGVRHCHPDGAVPSQRAGLRGGRSGDTCHTEPGVLPGGRRVQHQLGRLVGTSCDV